MTIFAISEEKTEHTFVSNDMSSF